MAAERFNIDDTQVQMVMVIKLRQLQREYLPALSYRNLEQYLSEELWKDGAPSSLHEAADDVMRVTANDIVRYLARRAEIEGRTQKLSDFLDVIGG